MAKKFLLLKTGHSIRAYNDYEFDIVCSNGDCHRYRLVDGTQEVESLSSEERDFSRQDIYEWFAEKPAQNLPMKSKELSERYLSPKN